MKSYVTLIFALLLALPLSAQENADTLWTFNGVSSLNFSQMSLTNWAAGGENSVSGNAMVNLNANYMSKDENVSWTNELTLGYGLMKQGADNVRKTDDKIDFASKFGYKASKKWYYSGLLSFKTQFTEGYANPGTPEQTKISNFLAPGYINLSLGMDFKPNKSFTMLVAPLTGKVTIVGDEDLSGSFGVPVGETVRSEFGGYVKIAYATELMKNVKLNTKIDLFSNYLENPQYVDVNFDLILSFKVNDYISASFISQMIYDRDIQFAIEGSSETEAKIQFKELFGLGLTYSF